MKVDLGQDQLNFLLRCALKAKSFDLAKQLLSSGANIHHYAKCIDQGVEIEGDGGERRGLLKLFIYQADFEIIKFLLDNGAYKSKLYV